MSKNQAIDRRNLHVVFILIEKEILRVQNKIFVCSQKCNLTEVKNLQCVLLRNQYIRFFATYTIIKQLEKYHWICTKNRSNLKVFILHSLQNNNKNFEKLSFIQERIKKYLMFLILQAEWKPRREHFLKLKKNLYTVQ